MCRLVAYLGHTLLLEDVLVRPINSIVSQSLHARETRLPTNGDGFGLGWYAPEISPEPALFKSIYPAWNDHNLLNLTAKIQSPAFFAHVRAASAGGVSHYNCHPFMHGRWMLMHNGEICHFLDIKRHLRRLLDDDMYQWIKGETDSEHLFALFLQLSKGHDLSNVLVVAERLQATFAEIEKLSKAFTKPGPSYYNICLTDGKLLVATRYCTDKVQTPETMHYALGSRFVEKDMHFHMLAPDDGPKTLLVASERLTNFDTEWRDVPANHMMMVTADKHIEMRALGENHALV